MPLSLTREHVRRIDRYAIEQLGIRGVVLMENAGRNVADAVERFCGGRVEGLRIAVVAGAGNNGGDGFVVARHLAMRGAQCVTFVVVPQDKITGDARENLTCLRALGQDVRFCEPEKGLSGQLQDFVMIVDAIGGTGISGRLRGVLAQAVEQVNASGVPVVAVDIPTGLDCDSGLAEGPAIHAALTVTLCARKKGFDHPGSASFTGEVVLADIGVPAETVARLAGLMGI